MKIIYWPGFIGNKFGAYEKYILLLAGVCKNRGHHLIVLHEGSNDVPVYRNKLNELGAEYVSIPNTVNEPRQGIPAAIRVIRKYQPDIVHFNFTNPLVLPLAKLSGVPLVYRTCHNGLPRVTGKTRISRIMNNVFVDRFFAISNFVRNDEIRAGVRKDKLFLNFLGLPLEDYNEKNISTIDKPHPARWNDTQVKKIITIGRFIPLKGMKFVIEVAIETLHRYLEVTWWMVGGVGPDYIPCVDMVKQAHLENRILFLLQRNDVPALLTQAYIHVVGSVFEGLGLNVLESSLLKVPTVGPRWTPTGLNEAIQNYKTGFLIESRSVESMVSAISLLLENPSLRSWMGENAKKYVIEKYNSFDWIEQLINYYELDYKGKVN